MAAAPDDNALLALVKAARIRGKDYMEIERLYGIPAPRAEAMMKAFFANKAAAIDPIEQRMLQLDRLEGLIDVLMSMAEMGNIKSAEVLLKTLEQISALLGLNLEQTKIEIKIVTEQQADVIYRILQSVAAAALATVQSTVTNQKQLSAIEEQWDTVIDASYSKTVEEIIEAELVEK